MFSEVEWLTKGHTVGEGIELELKSFIWTYFVIQFFPRVLVQILSFFQCCLLGLISTILVL